MIAVSIFFVLDFDIFVDSMKTANPFLLDLLKLLMVVFLQLVFFILAFFLFLFIYLFFLFNHLSGFCKKWVVSVFEPFFIIF